LEVGGGRWRWEEIGGSGRRLEEVGRGGGREVGDMGIVIN